MLEAELEHQLGERRLAVALEVEPGGCLALAGPSGAGKTTILRLLAGTLAPAQGRIVVDDEVWVDTDLRVCRPPERRRCGYVFQDYALFPHLSAWRNVAYGMRGGRRERRAAAIGLLERFGLGQLAQARPTTLSGGERQRVALARALAARPSVLLLDEPLSALDVRSRAAALRTLVSVLGSLEIPAVLVTHDFGQASLLGDEVGVIDGGHVIQRGSPQDLAARPASAFVADFTGAVVLVGSVRSSTAGLTVVTLDGGGTVSSTDSGSGRVAASVYPWEITLRRSGTPDPGDSAQNHIQARVSSLTRVANRVRVGLAASQPLAAEVTGPATDRLGLVVGAEVVATWKATATRLMPI